MAEVASFVKGLEILRHLAPDPGGRTAAELGEALGIPRTTALRFLNTLCGANYAVKSGSGYTLGPAALMIAGNYTRQSALMQAAQRACAEAAARLPLPVSFFIEGDGGVILMARRDQTGGALYDLAPGARLSLSNSAAGIAVLSLKEAGLAPDTLAQRHGRPALAARIDEVRRTGLASSQDEVASGYAALAVPVRTTQGVGAFHAVFHRTRDLAGDLSRERIAEVLRETARSFAARRVSEPRG